MLLQYYVTLILKLTQGLILLSQISVKIPRTCLGFKVGFSNPYYTLYLGFTDEQLNSNKTLHESTLVVSLPVFYQYRTVSHGVLR